MKIQFRKFSPQAVTPTRAHPFDAGWDIVAVSVNFLSGIWIYKTGLGAAIPPGFVGILKERSSIRNRGMVLLGGVIDSGFTGEIEVSFICCSGNFYPYQPGEKICQLLIVPIAPVEEFEEVLLLPESQRGANGFGSTGV